MSAKISNFNSKISNLILNSVTFWMHGKNKERASLKKHLWLYTVLYIFNAIEHDTLYKPLLDPKQRKLHESFKAKATLHFLTDLLLHKGSSPTPPPASRDFYYYNIRNDVQKRIAHVKFSNWFFFSYLTLPIYICTVLTNLATEPCYKLPNIVFFGILWLIP